MALIIVLSADPDRSMTAAALFTSSFCGSKSDNSTTESPKIIRKYHDGETRMSAVHLGNELFTNKSSVN